MVLLNSAKFYPKQVFKIFDIVSAPVPIKIACDVFEPICREDNRLSPVIFLHGITGTRQRWLDIPQMVAEKSKRKTYAPDARNHGDSEYTNDFSFDLNVDDLFHFMDTINTPKAILVGHSMGAVTAIKAALRNPERVEMLFSEDTSTNFDTHKSFNVVKEYMKFWKKSVEKAPKGLSPTEAEAFAKSYLCNNFAKDLPQLNEETLRLVPTQLKCSPEGVYRVSFNEESLARAFKMENQHTLISEITGQYHGPAYFFYGSRSSHGVEKEGEAIKRHFPRMKFVRFEGATHMLHYKFPEKFVETIVHYLKIGK